MPTKSSPVRHRSRKLPELSLFFPTYNEEANIGQSIREALSVLPQVARKYEVIVVNDGSKDRTRQIVSEIAKRNSHVRLVSQRNLGYGGALKRGFKEARYSWVFFTDADLQFDLQELKTLVQTSFLHDVQFVLGYRLNRAEGLKRQLFARALKLWNRVLLGFPRRVRDIDCAFKLIHTDVIRRIEPLFSDGAMISTELILKAHCAGFSYEQVGVHHYPRVAGKPTGNNVSVILKAVRDTFFLKFGLLSRTTGWNSARTQLRKNPHLAKLKTIASSLL